MKYLFNNKKNIINNEIKKIFLKIVRSDRKMERVVFPIHEICSYLSSETQNYVFINTDRDAQGSKVTEFFNQWTNLYEEMNWQKKLQGIYLFFLLI